MLIFLSAVTVFKKSPRYGFPIAREICLILPLKSEQYFLFLGSNLGLLSKLPPLLILLEISKYLENDIVTETYDHSENLAQEMLVNLVNNLIQINLTLP